jgi:hypothetical protein
MDTNGSSTLETGKFRSSYLNSLVAEYFKAEARNGLHQKTMKLIEQNYAGDKLQELTAEENRQYRAGIDQILLDMDDLAGQERERLESGKRNEVTGTSEQEMEIIAKIDRLSDIISREELQIMADTYKDSSLVQRKLRKTADNRGFGINIYPGYDQKIETVLQTAADMKSFISSRDFGLTPAFYIEMQLGEADDILSPVIKEADEA